MKLPNFELKRRKLMEENKNQMEKLGLRKLADDLTTSKSKGKNIVEDQADLSNLEFDRDYVPGHDSVDDEEDDNQEEEEVISLKVYHILFNI